jgi:hypothetical protein
MDNVTRLLLAAMDGMMGFVPIVFFLSVMEILSITGAEFNIG